MDVLKLKLTDFDGPLDLLLTLIRENKMDIDNLDLAVISDQYLKFIYAQSKLEINEASEYLLMASQLIYIKSKSMLASTVKLTEEDQIKLDDEKQKLINQILLYKKYRDVVEKMKEKYSLRQNMHSKDIDDVEKLLNMEHNKTVFAMPNQIRFETLQKCYLNAYEKWRLNIFNNHKIVVQEVSAEQVEKDILALLNDKKSIKKYTLSDFFNLVNPNLISKQYLVTCFVCLLDLAKNGIISLSQNNLEDEIYINII